MEAIKLVPLASESMGVRSMCTFIETPSLRLLIDPGASLARRWGLFPHPIEYGTLLESRERIAGHAERSEVVVVSHYHFDHCTPSFTDCVWNLSSFESAERVFKDKIVLAKRFRKDVNPGQRRRGWLFKKLLGDLFKDYQAADGRSFSFQGTRVSFSNPVFHGEQNTPLGWVLMTTVEHGGECAVHASDVQGPMLKGTVDLILSVDPDLVYVSGPPLYLSGYRVKREAIERGVNGLTQLADRVSTVIVDHHLLRDEGWRSLCKRVFKTAEARGNRVVTAAEFNRMEDTLLEAGRKRLYEEEPPSQRFYKWTRLSREKRRLVMPPI